MDTLFPIITMTDLQRKAKDALAGIEDYAVIQSHGNDVAFVLHPTLGKLLLESGMLRRLQKTYRRQLATGGKAAVKDMDALIGQVLRELSKR